MRGLEGRRLNNIETKGKPYLDDFSEIDYSKLNVPIYTEPELPTKEDKSKLEHKKSKFDGHETSKDEEELEFEKIFAEFKSKLKHKKSIFSEQEAGKATINVSTLNKEKALKFDQQLEETLAELKKTSDILAQL